MVCTQTCVHYELNARCFHEIQKSREFCITLNEELEQLKLSNSTLLARELIAVAYANGATANAQGDAATISPNPR